MPRWSARRKVLFGFISGIIFSIFLVYLTHAGMEHTSTNEYCESCHVHPHATESWEEGPHFATSSGMIVDCVSCHLPPDGVEHYVEKVKAGARDLYGYYFKDISEINWDALSSLDHAVEYTFDSACVSCHQELFPVGLADKGVDAHLHYSKNTEELRCINCHLDVGHFQEEPLLVVAADTLDEEEIEIAAPLLNELDPGAFVEYSELIPGSDVRFEMVPITGGVFQIGSSPSSPFHQPDEGPQRQVQISSFWMGKHEITWHEYDAFFSQTATRGKNEMGVMSEDAMTGPTPPYGSPDQGWGKEARPAITMTHFAAQKYCDWLSAVTGRRYRLPTEAEWEYACRGGTDEAFYFTQSQSDSWIDRWYGTLFGGGGIDEEMLQQHAWYIANSSLRTHLPKTKESNPFGLYNMLGNVREFCQDWYSPDVYSSYPADRPISDPEGPPSGEEHVVRGGSYKSEPAELRCAARDHTRHDAWLKTDPQSPKSVWWYSDSTDVGFRIVREYEENQTANQ